MFNNTEISLLLIIVPIIFICGVAFYKAFNNKEEKQISNYKNISQMAQNLLVCKVSTRKQVLTELYNNPKWSESEVDELKSLLEVMLGTTLHINKPGETQNNGLIAKGK